MRTPSPFLSRCLSTLLFVWSATAFFNVTQPVKDTQWVNGQTNVISWTKGLLDHIEGFDIEITRMSVDGLILVAQNVPAKPAGLNLFIENIPAGNDYVLIFINSTHGVLQGSSQPFTILAASSTPTSTLTQSAVAKAATVTVTTGPNPGPFFATTFPALPWSAGQRRSAPWVAHRGPLVGLLCAMAACVAGASYVLL